MPENEKKLPKSNILRSQKDFSDVLSLAHREKSGSNLIIRCDPFVIYRKPGAEPRLGMSIAKRIIKESPKRNRIKRVLREWFRHNKSDIKGDIVVRLLRKPTDFTSLALIASLKRCSEALKK